MSTRATYRRSEKARRKEREAARLAAGGTPKPKRPGRVKGTIVPGSARRTVRALVDKYAGENAERVVHAYAVLALGTAQTRLNFFGESVKLSAKDRIACLNQLALRRWGRVPLTMELDPDAPDNLPIQIINVFAGDEADGSGT